MAGRPRSRPHAPARPGRPALLPLPLLLVLAAGAPRADARQPGEPFWPNSLQGPFHNSFQSPLGSRSAPTASSSSFSATLAATTRFFASFSSASSSLQGVTPAECVPGEAATWPVPGTNCNMFYRCAGARQPSEYRTCPPGTVYYAEYQDCQYPTAAWRCWEPICTGRVDGLYPDWSTSCRRSVRCDGGRVVAAYGCPAGTQWVQASAAAPAAPAGCRPAHEASCPRVSDGSAPVHLSPQRVATPSVVPGPAHPLCYGKAPSLSQDRSPGARCRRYFRCSAGGQRSVETCPGTQVFDGARCVDPQYYVCDDGAASASASSASSASSCDRLPDGLHPQPGSRCRAYFRCALGYKSVFLCSGDSVFDGERCVPAAAGGRCVETTTVSTTSISTSIAAQAQAPPADAGLCAGKSFGYFADVSSGCRRYAYCLSGVSVGSFACGGGRRFDGRVCADTDYCAGQLVRPAAAPAAPAASQGTLSSSSSSFFLRHLQQHQSSPPPPPSPQQQLQGFFADLASGCRQYSFYIAGRETKLSCPPGLLFNGQLCVSENTYTCPAG